MGLWGPWLLVCWATLTSAQVLDPPYFNLAEGRTISATATCGEGVAEPELYCKLVGATLDLQDNPNINLIQGQVCDYCDPTDPKMSHPPEFAIDGTERWWQSPPLSRGNKFNEVNLTIDLGQEFHVAYVFIKMANSPRPGLWVMERSIDHGQSYHPWQFFADSPGECVNQFGKETLQPILKDSSVICETKFSKVVPLEGGEIVVSLLNGRPSADNFSHSMELQEWTKATNIRLRLLRTKNLLGHLMSVARQDPTVTRRYFYSIKDINIGGRCVCNGHAETCDITDPNNPFKLLCRCQHNTCGPQCDRCCPGFVQKKWKGASVDSPNLCEPCNCFGHSNECIYDDKVDINRQSLDIRGIYSGGGVCQNCQHNTEGINCDRCQPGYYKPFGKSLTDHDVCQPCNCDPVFSTGNCADGTGQCECRPQFLSPHCDKCNFGYYDYPECKPCDCHLNGTYGPVCEVGGGQCPCKPNYVGKNCDQCAEGYYGFPLCLACDCNDVGSLSLECDITSGQCSCRNSFGGRQCNRCDLGFFNYPNCQYCSCDSTGCTEQVCNNVTGTCLCKKEYGGPRCDQCGPGYFGYPYCSDCGCNAQGSVSSVCDNNGRCRCLINYSGQKCDQCSPGYYDYPECHNCNCDPSGSIGISCERDGRCSCKPNFDGEKCDKCKEGFYNYPLCEDCNCNPAGVLSTFAGCGSLTSGELCECKERVRGRICNKCRPLYWNLKANNPLGCEDCECHKPGTMGSVGVCEGDSGQCICKPNVASRKCDQCKDGFFELDEDNLFGCEDCKCDIGGSVNSYCDKRSGQCTCRPRVTGLRCNKPLQTHYFPTLHQLQYELEDGRTRSGTLVRFGFDSNIFPSFSWRGYAIFSDIQKEVLIDIYIDKPSLYHVLLKYLNFGGENVYGTITFTPDTFSETQQGSDIVFEPTREPKFVRVSGKNGVIASPFVINPGRWTVAVKIDRPLFVDYMVLLPQSYYEATLLQEDVASPCGQIKQGLCQHFSYPSFPEDNVIARGEAGYAPNGEKRVNTQLYTDEDRLQELNVGPMALLNIDQQSLHLDMRVPKPGQYVLVLIYHTPDGGRTSNVIVDFSTTDIMDKGKAVIYDCNYSFLCRQVVTDRDGKVGVFNFESNFASVTLTFEEDFNLAVDSVAAIPYDTWQTDYIMPQSQCVRENGVCKERSFPRNLPEAVKVEFESGFNEDRIAEENPPNIQDTESKMIYLDHTDPMVDVSGNVPQPGYYTFVIHYYQPDNPAFDMNVLIQNGQFYEAILPLSHCPSRAGCRSVILGKTTNTTSFQIMKNFVLSLKEPNHKSVWVDYVLAIPSDQFDESILQPEREDKAGEFLTQCGQNSFDIDTRVEGFCRDALFSLTSEYNNGALPCQCDIDGSLSFECQEFGGQCQCKTNTIGRTCSQCKTGYFGFPECKPCSCPSTSICHPVTGQCICPPRVMGEKCDTCVAYTYGLDPIIGCEECNCNHQGVYRGNKQCNLTDGQCQCKPNIVGRTCDQCQAGYWSFPFCQLCNCDLRGTQEGICDQYTSDCYCKENVHGAYCDQCKPGTFFLEENNPLGCTKCFCFGATDRCSSAYRYRSQIFQLNGWKANTVDLGNGVFTDLTDEIDVENTGSELRIGVPVEQDGSSYCPNNLYFSAPVDFLGNKITSYGGNLTYTLMVLVDSSEDSGGVVGLSDIVLTGNNITLVHHLEEQPVENQNFDVSVRIVEREFRHTTDNEVSREQLMMVLVNLNAIYIRACYFKSSTEVSLSNILLDKAGEDFVADSPQAVRVEQCQCPPNYKGTSCEECANGYYRAKTGPYLGYCVPCQCNGHSDRCDVETGQCFGCVHNTVGDHCDMCEPGYHGDATQGTPYDCLICACPLPIESNNFAQSCEVSPSGREISCQCQPGYYGPRCEVCAAGYFGEPEVPGSSCHTCDCSGNIDPDRPGSCDSITGECVLCLNNTFGSACELCAPGFYGDAIDRKDCLQCDCDDCGTRHCDSRDGICECKPNVVGSRCEQCAADHYGYDSCYGCLACNCGSASVHQQCDLESGQCHCHPGATGLACEVCDSGFWRYSPQGCISCNCDLKYSAGAGCDPLTGQCQCLPGVIGEKCDSCPYRWAFVQKQGCLECGPCIHSLLDETDYLRHLIDPVREELRDISGSYFAYKRLEFVNNSINELRPIVDEFISDPTILNLSPLEADLQDLERVTEHTQRRGTSASDSAAKEAVNADNTRLEALEVEKLVRETTKKAQQTVYEVQKLAEGLSFGSGPSVDRLVHEAERILEEIQSRDFEPNKNESTEEQEQAEDLLELVKSFRDPSSLNRDAYNEVKGQLDRLHELLKELRNHSHHALKLSNDAEDLNEISNKIPVQGAILQIKAFSADAEERLENATILLEAARNFTKDAGYAFEIGLKEKLRELESEVDKLKLYLDEIVDELSETTPKVREAEDHAKHLQDQADFLNSLLADTRETSEAAVKAATAYQTIAEEIEKARQTAEEALETAEDLKPKIEGDIDEVEKSRRTSDELLREAETLARKAQNELRPNLHNAKRTVQHLERENEESQRGLDMVEYELDRIPKGGVVAEAEKAKEASQKAKEMDRKTREDVQEILDQLPEKKNQADDEPRHYEDINQAIRASNNYVDRVTSIVPEITERVERLVPKARKTQEAFPDIADKIKALKHKVALARDQANRIKVGMRFYQNTTLQIRNPEAMKHEKSAAHTQISLYFRTTQSEGMLAYIGNLKSKHQKDEFLSIELRAGLVVVHMNLGGGSEQVLNQKYVADGYWHQVLVERTAKIVKVTVKTADEEPSIVEKSLPGGKTVFNIDMQNSKFYVGGIPDGVSLPDEVRTRRLDGCVEELSFGDSPIGLWNFLIAENLDGCVDRDQLYQQESTSGLKFDGTGYAILPRKKTNFERQTFISMKFKTFATHGLLFLIGKDRDYFALEIDDGHLKLKINLGEGEKTISTLRKVNNGEWHTLEANREAKEAYLKVDGSQVDEIELPGEDDKLATTNNIYVGGYNGKHKFRSVVTAPFEGCIVDLQISTDIINLNNNKEALGVVSGCPETVVRNVYFKNFTSDAYIAMPVVNQQLERFMESSFKFKTDQGDGILFYIANNDQSNYLALLLRDGGLVLRSSPGGEVTSKPNVRYDDSKWHYVLATRIDSLLSLDIDDQDTIAISGDGSALSTTTPLYFGGVPSTYDVEEDNVMALSSFKGCMGDVTFNGVFQNFAASQNKRGIALEQCPLADTGALAITTTSRPPTGDDEEDTTTRASPRPDDYDDQVTSTPEVLEPSEREDEAEVTSAPPPPTTTEEEEVTEEPERCALPLEPEEDRDVPAENGLRYGNSNNSHQQYFLKSQTIGELLDSSHFSLEFKTTSGDGVLLYVGGSKHVDYVGLFMRNNKIVYLFNCGSGPAELVSREDYNDGQWHRVVFIRSGNQGELRVDEEEEITGQSLQSTNSLNVQSPVFVGGLSDRVTIETKNSLKLVEGALHSFPGCIRNVRVQQEPVGNPRHSVKVQPCSDNAEEGTFFHSSGGYITLYDKFKVGIELEAVLKIKPRRSSGILMSVHGLVDFLILQMVDGAVISYVDNGGGIINSTVALPSKHYLCDGNWHEIKLAKTRNVLILTIDDTISSGLVTGKAGINSAETNQPLYFGGVPSPSTTKGVETTEQFVGCLRIERLKSKNRSRQKKQEGEDLAVPSINKVKTYGDVNLNTCSTI